MTNEANFLRDVENHVMTVIRDDGVNRYLRFMRPGDASYYFDMITWSGSLCFTGDMGTYVFSGLDDMFKFVRGGTINPGYWAEKLQAVSVSGRGKGGATEFDPKRFERIINQYRVDWMRDARARGLDKHGRRELWEAVDDEVLIHLDDGEHRVCQAADDFSWNASGSHQRYSYRFRDLFDHSFDAFTYQFLWCCYAMAWGVKTYDERQAVAQKVAA